MEAIYLLWARYQVGRSRLCYNNKSYINDKFNASVVFVRSYVDGLRDVVFVVEQSSAAAAVAAASVSAECAGWRP